MCMNTCKCLKVEKDWTEQQPHTEQGQVNQKHGHLSANLTTADYNKATCLAGKRPSAK